MANENRNVFTCLFDALKGINDNIIILSQNIAETHEKIRAIERAITDTAPNSPDAVIKGQEEKQN